MSDAAKAGWSPDDTRVAIQHGKVIGGAVLDWLKKRWRGKPAPTDPLQPAPAEPEKGILVIGPGGTGKTTFAKLISGQLLPWVFGDAWKYEESIAEETFVLLDKPAIEIVVPAGQEYRREASWANVRADLSSGRYAGVVFVAAFGHHSFTGLGYKSHPLWKGRIKQFREDYTEAKRREELAALEFLLSALESAPGKLWLLTLVTKQDLWWKTRSAMTEFYTAGRWLKTILKARRARGLERFRHEWCPVSLTMGNLKDSEGRVLFPNTAGYDVEEQSKSVKTLLGIFDALLQWEE